jgi:hypothetical protein
MAQTTSLKPSPVDVATTLGEIASAESTYDVMALAAQMLVGIAANSQASAGHLQTLATLGHKQHPMHFTLDTSAPSVTVKIDPESIKALEKVLEHFFKKRP